MWWIITVYKSLFIHLSTFLSPYNCFSSISYIHNYLFTCLFLLFAVLSIPLAVTCYKRALIVWLSMYCPLLVVVYHY